MSENTPIVFDEKDFDKSRIRKSYVANALGYAVSGIFLSVMAAILVLCAVGSFYPLDGKGSKGRSPGENLIYLGAVRGFYLPINFGVPSESEGQKEETTTNEGGVAGSEFTSYESEDTVAKETVSEELTYETESEEKTTKKPSEQESITEDGGEPHKEKIPTVRIDMTPSRPGEEYVINRSSYTPDIASLYNYDGGFIYNESSLYPLVLVLHTHTCEGYSADGEFVCYDGEGSVRDEDGRQTVVGIGAYFVNTLNSMGIPAVHCSVIHDKDSVLDSSEKARESIEMMLEMYPTIKYVIDIHRTSETVEGMAVRTSVPVFYTDCAQVQISVNYGGDSYLCSKNLLLALSLMKNMNSDGYKICRPVYLTDSCVGNYGYYISLDIGSMGNTFDEAKLAAYIAARAFADTIKGGGI